MVGGVGGGRVRGAVPHCVCVSGERRGRWEGFAGLITLSLFIHGVTEAALIKREMVDLRDQPPDLPSVHPSSLPFLSVDGGGGERS